MELEALIDEMREENAKTEQELKKELTARD